MANLLELSLLQLLLQVCVIKELIIIQVQLLGLRLVKVVMELLVLSEQLRLVELINFLMEQHY